MACERILAWQTGRQVGMGLAYVAIARDESKVVAVCFQGILAELERILYTDHVRFHLCHPYT